MHVRTCDFGVQADQVLIYQMPIEKPWKPRSEKNVLNMFLKYVSEILY